MNDNQSIIDIIDEYGNVISMELLCSFVFNDYNYIVYKDIKLNKIYTAKFQKGIDIDFNTDLSENEIKMVNDIYKELTNDITK